MTNRALIKLLTRRLELAAVQLDDAAGKLADWDDLKSANACATRAMFCRSGAHEGHAALGVVPHGLVPHQGKPE
jgi:hypothetical protein